MAKTKHTMETTLLTLRAAGYAVVSVEAVQHGRQARLAGGGSVTVYASGTRLAQGKGVEQLRAVLDGQGPAAPVAAEEAAAKDTAAQVGPNGGFVTTPESIGAILATFPDGPWDDEPSRSRVTAGPHDMAAPPF